MKRNRPFFKTRKEIGKRTLGKGKACRISSKRRHKPSC
jgi:hypothetical protein